MPAPRMANRSDTVSIVKTRLAWCSGITRSISRKHSLSVSSSCASLLAAWKRSQRVMLLAIVKRALKEKPGGDKTRPLVKQSSSFGGTAARDYNQG